MIFRWDGEVSPDLMVIAAPGPSLTNFQTEMVRWFKENIQRNIMSIVIGDVGRVMWRDADIMYHCDRKWWEYYNGAPEFEGFAKVSLEETNLHEVQQAPRSSLYEGLDLNFPYLVAGNNSGYQALNLAAHFRPKMIALIGYDMQDTNGKHNIVGDHPKEIKRPSDFPLFRERIGTLVKPLADLGITTYNCSENSALECFPKLRLDDVLRKTC